jgi:hypothetical protein
MGRWVPSEQTHCERRTHLLVDGDGGVDSLVGMGLLLDEGGDVLMNVVVHVLVHLSSGMNLLSLGLAGGSGVLEGGVHLVQLLLVLRSHLLDGLSGHLMGETNRQRASAGESGDG